MTRCFALTLAMCGSICHGQATPDAGPNDQGTAIPQRPAKNTSLKKLPRHIVEDQKQIWSAPFRMDARKRIWVFPAAGTLAGLLHSDPDAYRGFAVSASRARLSRRISDAGVATLAGAVASMYVLGRARGNEHLLETGVLGTEAAVNSLVVGQTLSYGLGRQRPDEALGRGRFFHGGNSFPSNHSLMAWSLASVIAHEYPGILTKLSVYSIASAVSVSRLTGRKHFPADVVVGGALGWALGRQVYERRHDGDLPGESIGTFVKSEDERDPVGRTGSPYVPADSWVYSALLRLQALGAVRSTFAGLRPWSRMECARLVREGEESLGIDDAYESGRREREEILQLLKDLRSEFVEELSLSNGEERKESIRISSLYSRLTTVSGPPLIDSLHFGQTIWNDSGRPVRRGVNAVEGFTADGDFGRFALHVTGEYQHSPSASLPASAGVFIAGRDHLPGIPGTSFGQVDRFRLMDSYFSLTVDHWQFSFGRQSLNWGPGDSGALNYSNNAEPVTMFRINRAMPAVLPGFLARLGPWRAEFFLGQLAGHRFARVGNAEFGPGFAPQPFIHGQKLSFRPTPNLEFGVSATTVWGGPGVPLNLKTFLRSFSLGNTAGGQLNDPGDRRAGFDFSYRVPGLRRWLTLYNDSMTEDEFSPIAYPRRSAMNPGIYIAQIPGIKKLDLRLEGFYTDLPGLKTSGTYYFNAHYLSGYTNQGNILGHAIGRQGSGFMAKSEFWASATNRISLSFRRALTSQQFLPGGGQMNDITARMAWRLRPKVDISAFAQYEDWKIPLLAVGRQSNVVVSFQITISPNRWSFRLPR